MSEQYYVTLSEKPAVNTASFATWVLNKTQLQGVLQNEASQTWTLSTVSTRTTKTNAFHPTAMARREVPKPIQQYLRKLDKRTNPGKVLYHGCGRDTHGIAAMSRGGRDVVVPYDPHHPDSAVRVLPNDKFDEVFSIYTLNVVNREVGMTILSQIEQRLMDTGVAVIAVRRDLQTG